MVRKILVALLIVLAAAGSIWGLWGVEATRLHEIRVVGSHRASEAQVRHLAGLTMGTPLIDINVEAAELSVLRHPWVASARVRRIFPDTAVVEVTEREIRALLMLDKLYLVDPTGEPFRVAGPPDLDYPVITGLEQEFSRQEPEIARRIIHEALAWLEALDTPRSTQSSAGQKLSSHDVSEVHFDEKSGYALLLRNGCEIRLGFRDRSILGRLDALLAGGVDLSLPHRIDLGFDQLAVVTPL